MANVIRAGFFVGRIALLAAFAVLFAASSGLSLTWLVLVVLMLAAGAAVFWSGDIKEFLLCIYFFTLPADLTKALIIPGGVYSPGLWLTLSDLALIPLAALWLFDRKVLRSTRLDWSPLHSIASLGLAWTWVTAVFAQYPLAGILAAIIFTKYYVAFLVISDLIRTRRQLRNVLRAAAIALGTQILMVGVQFLTNSPLEIQGVKDTTLGTRLVFEEAGGVHAFRPSGFLHHPNVLADYLVFLLPTILSFTLLGKRAIGIRTWIVAATLLAGGFLALIVSLSRGGWVAFFGAALFLLYTGHRRGIIDKRQLAWIGGAAATVAIAVLLVYPTVYFRLTLSDELSTKSRVEMIKQATLIISRYPMAGVGLGSYNHAAQVNIPASFANLNHWYRDGLLKGVVHNKYLLVAAEQGLVGLALFALLLWRALKTLLDVPKWSDQSYAALAMGLASSIMGQAVFYLFDHFYADVRIALLWSVLGLAAALTNMQRSASLADRGESPTADPSAVAITEPT